MSLSIKQFLSFKLTTMSNKIQVLYLITLLGVLHYCQAQGFYSTYNTPYQNSFAFATPNLKQVFTTKLASGLPSHAQIQQNQLYNTPQSFVNPAPYQQQNLPGNFFTGEYNGGLQQFPAQDDQALRHQLAYLQLQQQQQYQQQPQQREPLFFEQFQAPFVSRDTIASTPTHNQPNQLSQLSQSNQEQVKDSFKTQNLLGVAYSPSTKVSQVKFDNGKLKYDF